MTDDQETLRKKQDLVSGSLVANLTRMGLPLAAGMVLHSFYNITDAFWLGRHSPEALAAPGVTMPFFFFVVSFGMGFGNAGTALVAQFTGARRYREADHAAGQVLMLLLMLASALSLPFVIFTRPLMVIYGVPEAALVQVVAYFRIMMIAMPLIAFNIAYGAVLRALGDTIAVVIIGIVTNVVNVILDPFLIFGWAGLPEMGAAGAAVATVISQVIAAGACLLLIRQRRAGLEMRMSDLPPDWPILKKILKVGFPAAFGNSSSSLGFMGFQGMINVLGVTVIGAFTIGFRLVHFFNIPSQALAMAAAPIVGQALGAGKPALARRVVRLSVTIVGLGMIVPIALVMWQGRFVASLFVADPDVIAETGRFFLIVPASSYCFGVIMVLLAAFYGSGHTWPPFILSVLRLWFLRIPVAYILGFVLGLGSIGVYGGMVVGNVFSAVLALAFFRWIDWQHAIVPAPLREEKTVVEDVAVPAGASTSAPQRDSA